MTAPLPIPHPPGPLAGYRVLDFADEKGQLCARLLGELGADVIKVEPPREGDPTRAKGPFYKGEAGKERSLLWWAMNAGKRSATCQLKLAAGRELMHRLVATADIVIETNQPGEAAALGLDYRSIRQANPAAVLVSITNFGQTGPYKSWQATDLVAVAMGGQMHLNGSAERGPVRCAAPQALVQANAQAAVGALTALYARGAGDGQGQHVDVSMQEAVANTMDNAQATWDIRGINFSGPGLRRNNTGYTTPRYLFECADGWVAALQAGGLVGASSGAIIDWLAAAGEDNGLDTPEWRARLAEVRPLDEAERNRVDATMAAFCKTRKKVELVTEAQRRNAGWAPVFTPREIVESEHLAAREYWIAVPHEDLGETFLYPGAPWKLEKTPWAQRGRAPHVGEHNADVYGGLLGASEAELKQWRARMVI
ncbi:MAG: CaiB/BaiF CoA transferase family protein [Dehalococcoidia bacterium]